MKQIFQKITLVAFLILVAFLALFFTFLWTNSLFGNGGWEEREGIIDKLTIFIFYADMPVLLVASITSIISFFKRGHIWAPITKGIVINIIVAGLVDTNFLGFCIRHKIYNSEHIDSWLGGMDDIANSKDG